MLSRLDRARAWCGSTHAWCCGLLADCGCTRVTLLHHLIGALMLFSVLHFAEHRALLEWLDAAMIRIAGQGTEATEAAFARADASRPSVVQIERDAYANVFGDSSPLARARVAELLTQLNPSRTRLVVVDIDLAPSVSERAAGAVRPLDTALAALPLRGIDVVLGLPPPAPTAAGATLAWVRARCAEGVHFASADLHERLGVVSRVPLGGQSLATEAQALLLRRTVAAGGHAGGAKAGGAHAEGVHAEGVHAEVAHAEVAHVGGAHVEGTHAGSTNASGAVCAFAAQARDEIDFFARVDHAGAPAHGEGHAPAPAPLSAVASNWAFLAASTHGVLLRDGRAAIERPEQLRSVVFLGGAYDERERFMTVGGSAFGVQVHAASFTSLMLGTRDAPLWLVALLDIGLGVLFGVVFERMWHGYSKVEHWVAVGVTKPYWYWRFYAGRALLFLCWLVPLALAYIAIHLASTQFVDGLWLNPGPIIIGMFLHTLSLRHEHEHGDENERGHEHEQDAAAAHGEPDAQPQRHEHATQPSAKHAFWAHFMKEHPGSILIQLPAAAILLLLASL